MFSRCVVSIFWALRARRAALLTLTGAACLLAVFFSAALVVREDARALLPERPERLHENFTLLREAPFLRRLTFTVGGGGHDPAQLADLLAKELRSPEIPYVVVGPDVLPSPSLLVRLCDFMPVLLEKSDYERIASLLEPETAAASLGENKRALLSPGGLALRDLVAKDPLLLRNVFFSRMASAARSDSPGGYGGFGARIENGHLLDATGRYAMVQAEPAGAMSNADAAAQAMERARRAAASMPEGAEVFVVGGIRHTEANAKAVKEDLKRILPLSMALLALFFVVFIRSWRGLVLFLVPGAALALATTAAGMILGNVSGLVIGFGSVVAGITADYAIHVYYALKDAPDPASALGGVARPLATGAATTVAAFAALLFSVIPAISQMAVFAAAGIVAAFVLSLVALPHCLASSRFSSAASVVSAPACMVEQFSGTRASFRRPAFGIIWTIFAGVMVWAALTVPVSGDMRKLAYTPEDVRMDEEKSRNVWGSMRDGALVAAVGGVGDNGLEEALQINDAVWRVFARHGLAGTPSPGAVTSIAPFLPSQKTQQERIFFWEMFWKKHGETALALVESLRTAQGFSDTAFAPFAAWLQTAPQPTTLAVMQEFGLGMATDSMRGKSEEGRTVFFTLVPESAVMTPELTRELENAGGRVASHTVFREDVAEATRSDCLRFCLFSFLAIGGMLFFFFPSPGRWALAMTPLTAGMLAVTLAFKTLGLSMTVFHAAALPLTMGLAADYGIFVVSALERGDSAATRKAVLLSGLTTLSGFGCLAFARHPALFSLGATVGCGLFAAAVAALWIVPRICVVAESRP